MTLKEILYEHLQNQVRQIELLESIEELLKEQQGEKAPVPTMTRKEARQLRNQIQQYPIENKSESSEQL